MPSPPISGYSLWLDASQIPGVADGAALANWYDLSASGNNFGQSNGSLQPTFYKSTSAKLVNGLPAVWFNGTSQYMNISVAAAVAAQPNTTYLVAQSAAGSATGRVISTNFADANCQIIDLGDTGGAPFYYAGSSVSVGAFHAGTHVLGVVFNGASSAANLDGTYTAAGSSPGTGGFGDASNVIWLSFDGSAAYFNGPICEILVYPGAHSQAQMARMVTYLQDKWVLTPGYVGWLAVLNQLAGTSGLGELAAANAYAGTKGLGLLAALNVKAGTKNLGLNAVCNSIAKTTGLEPLAALNSAVGNSRP